jgi:hypothetical protein
MGTLLSVVNNDAAENWWQFVYYRQLGINSTHTAPITHQVYSWIAVTPWCTVYPYPTVGSLIVWNLVAPYYLTILEWQGFPGGPYQLIKAVGVGWLTSSRSVHCQSLPR